MRDHRFPLLVLTTLLVGCGTPQTGAAPEPHASSAPGDSVLALIPTGTVRVTVMNLVSPPRLEQLTARFQAAVQKEPGWWSEYMVANARPGEPLPYHPGFGITEAEYDEMLGLFGQMRLAPAAEVEMTVHASGDRRFRLNGGRHLPELTGIVIDLGRNRVETPFGATTTRNPIAASERQQATGPWTGVSWKYDGVDETAMSGAHVRLALGRLEESGRGILTYDAGRLHEGVVQARVKRTLTYDLPSQ
jgi:hypothetical protein